MESVIDKPALGWLRNVEFVSIDEGTVWIRPKPGHREIVQFATEPRRKSLAQLLGAILGRQVRVELQTPGDSATADREASEGGPIAADRWREAMELPLVRQVMDAFDVTIIDVQSDVATRRISPDNEATDDPGDSASDEADDSHRDDE